MDSKARIYIAGHKGLVGSAIHRLLHGRGYRNLICRTHRELDLMNTAGVNAFFEQEKPEYVFLAAARVGGILANATRPVDFLRENLLIEANIIHAAFENGVRKLQFLGSSCIYPKLAPQPLREDALLSGPLEPTNEWYAIAKIAGIKMAQAYRQQYGFHAISLMPTNLYGPNDNFDPEAGHVIPALMKKFHDAVQRSAPEVVIWGTGAPRREFLHVDDLAEAAVYLMETYDDPEIINVGTGRDLTIRELAERLQRVTGYSGKLVFDASKPDGVPRKLLDITKIQALGWSPRIDLETGLADTYQWYKNTLGESAAARYRIAN